MFWGCSTITEPPAVSNWDTHVMSDILAMFGACLNMTSLDVSGWDFSKAISSGYSLGLHYCSALRELKVPANAKIEGLPEHTTQGAYLAT